MEKFSNPLKAKAHYLIVTLLCMEGSLYLMTILLPEYQQFIKQVIQEKNITIEIGNFSGVGEYLLSDLNNRITYTEHNLTDPPSVITFSSSYTTNGKITITKDDRVNAILSGTFEFTATSPNVPNRIITVTSGRFDLNYKK